jgi:YHS domain-containing protein
MIRFFVLRIVVPLFLFWLLRGVIRSIFAAFGSQAVRRPERPEPVAPVGGELKKDPVCGTYVSTGASVTRRVNGQTLYFCSADCRDKYRAAS